MKIGVLAMQGAFAEHIKMLKSLGVEAVEIRMPEHLEGLDGLIIPGGESTTIGKMLDRYGLLEPLREKIREKFPVFGTCAGLIMLSNNIEDGTETQPLLGGLDVVSVRNAFGRQVDSFEAEVEFTKEGKKPFHGIFIRAPRVKSADEKVEVVAKLKGEPAAVRQDNILAISFHPELTGDTRFHEYFINMIDKGVEKNG